MFSFEQIIILVLLSAIIGQKFVVPFLPAKLAAKFGSGKNGNGKPITDNKELSDKMTKLEEHYNNETTAALKRIDENLTRNFGIIFENMAKSREDFAYIKAKLNGRI